MNHFVKDDYSFQDIPPFYDSSLIWPDDLLGHRDKFIVKDLGTTLVLYI